ncbi:MAG: CARDB domain-containing protein, partial [Ferruginibacter sp.]
MLSLAICLHANSQTETTIQKTKAVPVNTTQKPVTLQQQGVKNMAVPRLPDLRITSLNVAQISNTSGGKYLEISYTVKNEGTAAIDLSKIDLSGRIKISPTSIREDAGCGSVITTISGTLLNPGEARSGSYRCSIVLDFSVYKYYVLSVSTPDTVKELDVTNNSATTTILIQ